MSAGYSISFGMDVGEEEATARVAVKRRLMFAQNFSHETPSDRVAKCE